MPLPSPESPQSDYGLSSADLIAQADATSTLDLAWLFAVVRRRLWIMALVAGVLIGASGSFIVLKSRKSITSYQGSFKLLVEPITAEGRLAQLSVSAQSGTAGNSTTEISKVGVGQFDLMDYETQIRVLKSPAILNQIVQVLEPQYGEINYGYLYQSVGIERISYEKDGKFEGTKILEVSFQDESREKILAVLEQVAEVYLQYSLEERRDGLKRGINHIDGQLPLLEKRVDTLQKELQGLRETYNVSFPRDRARDLSAQTRELNSQRVAIQAELTEARANYTGLSTELAQGNPIPILLSSLPTQQAYGTLISQYQANEAQMALQSPQFKEDSPPFQILLEKRENLRQKLIVEAEAVIASVAVNIQDLEARLAYIQQTQTRLESETQRFPNVLRRYSDLEREVTVATESLKTFLTKRAALDLDASQQEIPWKLISPPKIWQTPDGQPLAFGEDNTKRTLLIASVLCMLVGVGAGFVVEILHTVYHTPDEVKLDTKLRLLGVIPHLRNLEPRQRGLTRWLNPIAIAQSLIHLLPFPGQDPSDAAHASAVTYRESFRSLYTNISLLGSKQMPIRSLVVGSATPDDGKSTIAEHLARTAAELDQRVLLVDADLRKPQLHQNLKLKNNYGLVDLVQHGLNLNEVIQQSPEHANLFFLSCGAAVDDPVKLLASDQTEHLIEQFRGFFDLVIYNTPPLVGLSDAQLLAAQADGLLLVVRLAQSDRGMVEKALENLKISGSVILGFVANDVEDYTPFNYISNYSTREKTPVKS